MLLLTINILTSLDFLKYHKNFPEHRFGIYINNHESVILSEIISELFLLYLKKIMAALVRMRDYLHKHKKYITDVVYFTGDFACGLSIKVNRDSVTDLV